RGTSCDCEMRLVLYDTPQVRGTSRDCEPPIMLFVVHREL
ncbi:MAG: hypothetical protein RLZZ273_1534, partial [Bacteroidota bacterium]